MNDNARPLNEGSDADIVQWLRALAQWIADVAESPTESARALVIADRLESLQSRCRALEALVSDAIRISEDDSDWYARAKAVMA